MPFEEDYPFKEVYHKLTKMFQKLSLGKVQLIRERI